MYKIFAACKAFVNYNGKILILRESGQYQDGTNVGRYDVPGGRVQPGESFDQGLIREIKEETGLDVQIGRPFAVVEWRPVVRDEQWQIVATFFECKADTDQVVLSEDHDNFVWMDPKDFANYPIIANMKGAFEDYVKLNQ